MAKRVLFQDFLDRLPKEQIVTEYIVNNKSCKECCDIFDVQISTFCRILKYYDITKPKNLHTTNIKKSKLERYGSENYNNESKRRHTNLEKYGVDNQFKRNDLMEEVRASNETKYGSKNNIYKNLQTRAANSGSITASYTAQVEKTRQTVLEKYGVDWASKADIVKNEIKESLKETFIEKYNCENYWVSPEAKRSNGSKNSHANLQFAELLTNSDIGYEQEFLLENRYYDFKVGNYLIEINPTATHNSTWSPWKRDEGIDKYYHADKTDLAIKNGFRCIHIWDWDDQQKIIQTFLKNNAQSIGARHCTIKEVQKEEEVAFLAEHHLQGAIKSSVALGLYYDDQLVMLMTFGKPRYSKKYEWEILRLCSAMKVVGGSQKLFNYFVKNFSPKSVISYCDLSKFEGNVYETLGFKKISRKISRHWYNIKLKDHITDKLLFKRGFDALLGSTYGQFGIGTDNEKLMLAAGFVEIYDCGQATYVWKTDN